jgi:hypothetical protein
MPKSLGRAQGSNEEPRPSRDVLVHRIAVELDKPGGYMSGPSKRSLRVAEIVADVAVERVVAFLRDADYGPPKDKYAEARQAGWADAAFCIEQEFGDDG